MKWIYKNIGQITIVKHKSIKKELEMFFFLLLLSNVIFMFFTRHRTSVYLVCVESWSNQTITMTTQQRQHKKEKKNRFKHLTNKSNQTRMNDTRCRKMMRKMTHFLLGCSFPPVPWSIYIYFEMKNYTDQNQQTCVLSIEKKTHKKQNTSKWKNKITDKSLDNKWLRNSKMGLIFNCKNNEKWVNSIIRILFTMAKEKKKTII